MNLSASELKNSIRWHLYTEIQLFIWLYLAAELPQQAGLWATSPENPGAAGCCSLAKQYFTASSDLRRSAVGSVLNSLHRICLPHPFSAVKEKDSTQIGAQSSGRTLAEELSASALARGSLGAVGRGVLMFRTGCTSLLFFPGFQKGWGWQSDSIRCCVWKDF